MQLSGSLLTESSRRVTERVFLLLGQQQNESQNLWLQERERKKEA